MAETVDEWIEENNLELLDDELHTWFRQVWDSATKNAEAVKTSGNNASPKLPSLREFVQWYREQNAVGPEACYYHLTRQNRA